MPKEGDASCYILQGLSLAAFLYPDELMENFVGITSYLRDKIIAAGGDPLRETLSLVKTRDGKDYYTDSNGKVWRLMASIENTDCFQKATPEHNLNRARTQFKLVKDMEEQFEAMAAVVTKYA